MKGIVKYFIRTAAALLGTAGIACAQAPVPEGPPPFDPNAVYVPRAYNLVDKIVENGDTIAYIHIKPVVKFRRPVDTRRYNRLVRNLKIVYPIAKYANYRLARLEEELKAIPDKREQQRYVKQVEKELKAQYTPILKKMSFSQGKLLIKLIDRETGHTSYDLVKELRGGFSAFFWQGIARLFGANLKDTYDAAGEDRVIEQLIALYEAGQL